MARMPQKATSPAHPHTTRPADPRLDPVFIERERNRFGARALAFLVLLNGAAALVLLAILGNAPESSVDSKVAAAMVLFSGGAVAALLSSFLAYINRTVAMEAPERAVLRRALQICGIVVVIGSAAAFLTGMNMVGDAASERSSSHPKGPKERQQPKQQSAPTAEPSERVELPTNASGSPADFGALLSEPGR
jgi:zinc transporter ZupT